MFISRHTSTASSIDEIHRNPSSLYIPTPPYPSTPQPSTPPSPRAPTPQPAPDRMALALLINMRGVKFCLTWAQVEAEPGNKFEEMASEFHLRGERPVVDLSRRPDIFQLVVDHLSGIAVFPIARSMGENLDLPRDVLIRYLIDDATVYRLPKLKALAEAEQRRLQEEEDFKSTPDDRDIIKIERLRLRQKLEMEKHRQDYKMGLKRLEETSFVEFLQYQLQMSKQATAQKHAQTALELGLHGSWLGSLFRRWRRGRAAV